MRWRRLTGTFAFVAISFTCSHVGADDAAAVAGQDIYDSYCGACHGFDGTPLLPNVPNFAAGERMEKSDSELIDSIREGKGSVMPGWVGVLSDEECAVVLQFIRERHAGS